MSSGRDAPGTGGHNDLEAGTKREEIEAGNRGDVGPVGGLRICGCLWRVASDDFVVPAWIEFFTRCIGLAILVGVLSYEEMTLSSCASQFHLNVYLMVAIILFTLTIIDLALLGHESAKGSIWDVNPSARRYVPTLIYINIFLTVGEFLWALTGSIWVVRGMMTVCMKLPDEKTLVDVPVYAIFGVIVTTWIGLGIKVIVSCLSYNTVERPDNSFDSRSTWSGRLSSKVMSLCVERSQINLFKDVAEVMEEIFDEPSFVPTDIAAGLMLLSVTQHRQACVSSSTSTGQCHTEVEEDDWKSIRMAQHLIHYAGASYGYTWFYWRNACCSLFRLRPHIRCFACCGCAQEHDIVDSDNCLFCQSASLRFSLPHLDDDCLFHISFRNKLTQVPFFVAADHEFRTIVVSIRGTNSLQDAVIDLCATAESMVAYGQEFKDFKAHGGMLKAAAYVYNVLVEKKILEMAFDVCCDYQLVVTGHSMGAGIAVLLGFMLRKIYPFVKCYAFSPPGALLNEAAAKASETFTLSIIVGKDFVPRLNLQSVTLLKKQLKEELTACPLPKYQVLATGMFACCAKNQDLEDGEDSVSRSVDATNSGDAQEPILGYRNQNPLYTKESSSSSRRVSDRVEHMFVPGVVWHFEQRGVEKKYVATVKTFKDFQEILVSTKMLTDHFPHLICDVLSAIC